MHPPPFSPHQRLSDWPKCYIELHCLHCRGRSASFAVRRMLERHGDRTFIEMLKALKCEQCGHAPAPVYLCASMHRECCKGPTPDWAVELVPAPDTRYPAEGQAEVLPFAKSAIHA